MNLSVSASHPAAQPLVASPRSHRGPRRIVHPGAVRGTGHNRPRHPLKIPTLTVYALLLVVGLLSVTVVTQSALSAMHPATYPAHYRWLVSTHHGWNLLQERRTGLCLTAAAADDPTGHTSQRCNGANRAQLWRWTPNGLLQDSRWHRCLDVDLHADRPRLTPAVCSASLSDQQT